MQEKVEEYPLGLKLHLNAFLDWICGLWLWQSVNLEGSHILFFILLYDTVYYRLCDLHGSRILSSGEMRRV